MNIETYREYCLLLDAVTECMPFDNKTLVFKVGNKLFALTGVDDFKNINLKCNPEKSVELRDQFDSIIPGFHMNKKHWNTLEIDGSLSDKLILELTNHSYDLVRKSLPKKIKEML